MKRYGDWVAFFYILVLAVLLFIFQKDFIYLTKTYPYPMGFLKVALLATFGECLKMRLTKNSWKITKPIARFLVWGLFGMWFTYAFAGFSFFVDGLVKASLWPSGPNFWIAFSKSLAINPLGGYAFSMMVSHEYFNKVIEKGRIISLRTFAECMTGEVAAQAWFGFIPKTIFFFWIPAHTVTFLLPGYYRVLFAAALAVVLGFIITLAKKK